ncbi:MAG: hypothetical protein MUC99_12145 [Anaerolineae bacterium]|jgi:hypothetical protein|nr:hypothetical protein [Anaerolineae bacterium]
MKDSPALIERITLVNDTHQHLELTVADELATLKPGQFAMARVGDSWEPYLREPWVPVDTRAGRLIVERPIGEVYRVGDTVKLLGPCGQTVKFRKGVRNVLFIAYETAPTPLLMPMRLLLRNNVAATLVLLGDKPTYDARHLPPEVEVIQGDMDINWPNQVMTVGWADQVFVCVRQDDELFRFAKIYERFSERRNEIPKNYLFGMFQSGMACGFGVCDACALRVGGDTLLACMVGPAFDLTMVKLSAAPGE